MHAPLTAIESLIIDMDGVLWRGTVPLPGVAGFFDFLKARSIRFLLATNNATRTADYAVERMRGLGVEMTSAQVLTSAAATARWLSHVLHRGAGVFVIGEAALADALEESGFSLADEKAAAVVVGLDRGFTYDKLRRATAEIRAGARFVATNGDATFPGEEGLVPGAGSLVAAVQTATSLAPTVVGKPHRPMFDTALEILQTAPEHTAMLGDRLDTDIEGAHAVGLTTLLVLTGVSTAAEAQAAETKPDWIIANLIELRERWEKEYASLEAPTSQSV